MAVKVMIDSASDISEKEAKELGLIMIPITISFGKEEFSDGVNLLPTQFYEKLINSDFLPKTSQINSYTFEEKFKKHTENGNDLIVITISSKLSGTYENACRASESFNGKVQVVDSMNACIGERLLGLYALNLSKEGMSAKEIASELDKAKSNINVIAVIDTLEYLKKGGRISSAAAFAGKLFAIKPVIGLTDGEVKVIGKAIGSKNGLSLLNKIVKEKGGINFDMPYGTLWSGLDKTSLEKYIKDNSQIFDNKEKTPTYILGGTIGTHLGPGAIGLAFFNK